MRHLLTALLVLLFSVSAVCEPDIAWYSPWAQDKGYLDMSFLNSPILDQDGFVYTHAGQFYRNGSEIRFWGTGLNFNALFPTHDQADSLVKEWSNSGYNLFRIHNLFSGYFPAGIWKNIGSFTEFDNTALDRLFYLIAACKAHGIYIEFEPHVSQQFTAAEGCVASGVGQDHTAMVIDAQRLARIKLICRDFLTVANPYTGKALINDPVLALVVGSNEEEIKWQNDVLDGMPTYFQAVVDTSWYDWLLDKYVTIENLKASWGVDQPIDPLIEIIQNGTFNKDVSNWSGSWGSGASGSISWEKEGGPDGGGALRFITDVKGGAGQYDIFLRQYTAHSIVKDMPYRLVYYCKSFNSRFIHPSFPLQGNLSGRSNHENEGSTIQASPMWKRYEYLFWAWSDVENVEFRFNGLGYADHDTIRFDSVSISPFMPEDLQSMSFGSGLIPRMSRMEARWHEHYSHKAVQDYVDFIQVLNYKYFMNLYSFLKDTLGYNGLVGSTQGGITPYVPGMDFLACHGMTYSWFGGGKYKFHKKSVLTIMSDNVYEYAERYQHYVQVLSHIRSPEIPFILDEMAGELAPNGWAETYLLCAIYGSLQRIGGVVNYAHASIEAGGAPNVNWYRQRVLLGSSMRKPSSDNLAHPGKLAVLPIAALIFREGLVSPSMDTVRVYVDSNMYKEKLIPNEYFVQWGTYPAPNRAYTHACAWIPPEIGMMRRVEFIVSDTTYIDGDTTGVNKTNITSSTGEITWHNINIDSGIVEVNADRVKLFMGDIGGKSVQLGDVKIDVSSLGHYTVAMVSLDDKIATPGIWNAVVVALGAYKNSAYADSMGSDGYYYVRKDSGGVAPTLVDGVNATIELPYGSKFMTNPQVLDSLGEQKAVFSKEYPVVVRLRKANNTVWYEVGYNARIGATIRKKGGG